MKYVPYIAFILIFASCSKTEYSIQNLNNDIDVMGHAGMGLNSSYPMNSMESLLTAINSGSDGSEMDVQLTKDSVLVAFHDLDLEEKTTLSGRVIDHTWEELKNSYYTETPFTAYKIVRLEDIFSTIENPLEHKYTFDCKVYPSSDDLDSYCAVFAEKLVEFISEHDLQSNLIIEASSVPLISALQIADPSQRILYYPGNFDEGYEVATNMNLFGITISTLKISSEQMQKAHDAGLFVAIWQVRTKKMNREAILKNPDMIQSDKLKHLINELK